MYCIVWKYTLKNIWFWVDIIFFRVIRQVETYDQFYVTFQKLVKDMMYLLGACMSYPYYFKTTHCLLTLLPGIGLDFPKTVRYLMDITGHCSTLSFGDSTPMNLDWSCICPCSCNAFFAGTVHMFQKKNRFNENKVKFDQVFIVF